MKKYFLVLALLACVYFIALTDKNINIEIDTTDIEVDTFVNNSNELGSFLPTVNKRILSPLFKTIRLFGGAVLEGVNQVGSVANGVKNLWKSIFDFMEGLWPF